MAQLWMSTWLIGCLMVVFFPLSTVCAFNGPSDVTVVETNTAVLTCSSGPGVTIEFSAWIDIGTGSNFANADRVFSSDPKYTNFVIVNADTANGQMDLHISNAQYEDQGIYSCQINGDTAAISATLTVEAQVTSVTMTINGASTSPNTPVDVTADEEQTLVCTAVGARPRVGIDWTNDGVSVSGDTETESTNGDATDTISTLLYTPNRNDNGHQFQCTTTGQQAAIPQSQSVTLNVQYAPYDVKVEYSQGTITCTSKANPTVVPNNQYVIILNNTMRNIGNTLLYNPEDYGCTTVMCEATNTISPPGMPGTDSLEEPLCPAQGAGAAIIAVAVVIPLVVILIIVVAVVICYNKKIYCFDPNKTASGGGTLPKKQPSAQNADMIRNQAEVRQSVHKYDDEPKKPRIPRSSTTGDSKKQPVNDAPRQSSSPIDDHRGYPMDSYDGRNETGGGEGGLAYADLEFKNRPGNSNGHGDIHYPEEQTQYASILV